ATRMVMREPKTLSPIVGNILLCRSVLLKSDKLPLLSLEARRASAPPRLVRTPALPESTMPVTTGAKPRRLRAKFHFFWSDQAEWARLPEGTARCCQWSVANPSLTVGALKNTDIPRLILLLTTDH